MKMKNIKKEVNTHLYPGSINTNIHNTNVDDEEQIHEEQSTDDILNIEWQNKDVVIENNTNDDEETDNDLQEEQAALDL